MAETCSRAPAAAMTRGTLRKRAAAVPTEKAMPFRYATVRVRSENGVLDKLPFFPELEFLLIFAAMVGSMFALSELGHCVGGQAYGAQGMTSMMLLWMCVQSVFSLGRLVTREWNSDTRLSLYVALASLPVALFCLYLLCQCLWAAAASGRG